MIINELLNKFETFVKENNYEVYSISCSTSNELIKTRIINPIDFLPDNYSVAKAWCVLACGMLYDEGKLDLEEPITKILKEELNYPYNPIWDTITVHDTLKHHLGIEENYLDIDCEDPRNFGDDYLRYVFQTAEFKYTPKVDFVYTDAAFYLISRIVYKKAGKDIEQYLKEKFFDKVGIKDYTWTKCPYGYSMGATGLYMKSVDTVKLPLLLLNNGVYHNERFISLEWMNILEQNHYENYYFEENGWYQKGGMAGQIVMYNKKYNLAISWNANCPNLTELREFIFNNVTERIED